MNKVRITMCIMISALLCGCVGCSYKQEEIPVTDVSTLGIIPDFNYDVPIQQPEISVDNIGYRPSAKKVIYIEGTDLNQDFRILNMNSGEVAFDGVLKSLNHVENDGLTLYVGDFTACDKEGTYRVYQSNVGYSEEFIISDNIYSDMCKELYNQLRISEYKSTENLIYTLSVLLEAHKFYPDSYIDNGFIDSKIELLLRHQHPTTGAIYQELQSDTTLDLIEEEIRLPVDSRKINTDDMVSLTATAEFAGLMGQYYHLHLEDNTNLATRAYDAGIKAYNLVDRNRDSITNDSYYYASSELYRASGQFKYRNGVEAYDSIAKQSRTVSDYNYTMLADMAYLGTFYKTNYNRCEEIMGEYMDTVVDLLDRSDKQHYYVQSDIEEIDTDQILDNMIKMGMISYILSGREYAMVQNNYIHYLAGNNAGRYNDINAICNIASEAYDTTRIAKLIYVLSANN